MNTKSAALSLLATLSAGASAALAPAALAASERPFLVALCGPAQSDAIDLQINAIVVDGKVQALRATDGSLVAGYLGAETIDETGDIVIGVGRSVLRTERGPRTIESLTINPGEGKVLVTFYVSGSDGDVHVDAKQLDCSIHNVGLLLAGRLAK